jgi:hypothetical protein
VCDLLQKIELLHAAGTQFSPANAEPVVKTFYEILTVLDNKALALLAFDGIVVAATTFAAEKANVFHQRGITRWLAILVIVLCLAAAALCLGVAEVSYRFLYYVACSAPDKLDFTDEINHLATVVEWRTLYYQVAWGLSLAAIPLFLIMFWFSLDWRKPGRA